MRQIHQKEFVDIYIDDENGWLYANWKGYQSDASIMEGANLLHDTLKDFAVTKVLNDNREVMGIWTGMAGWIAMDWFPRLRTAGMTKFALIYSPSRFSQISADAAMLLHDPDRRSAVAFVSVSAAREWLATD